MVILFLLVYSSLPRRVTGGDLEEGSDTEIRCRIGPVDVRKNFHRSSQGEVTSRFR
jgi:hypothetical protein